MAIYGNSAPSLVTINTTQNGPYNIVAASNAANSHKAVTMCGYNATAVTYYIWSTYTSAASNSINIYGFYIQK